jgi:ornithine carbamoyltransferase
MALRMKNVFDLSFDELEKILSIADTYLTSGIFLPEDAKPLRLIGTMFHNAPTREVKVAEAVAARLGSSCIHFDWNQEFTLSRDELLREVSDVSSAVDLLLTAYVDQKTFGAGRMVTEQFCGSVQVPLINMIDDIYANQSALAQLLAIKHKLGTLNGKRIAVSWGFGSKFVLPNIAHSVVILSSILGANVRIISPKPFPLLKRAIKKAGKLRTSSRKVIEEIHDFKGALKDVDAVFALNWCCLEQFNHPARNAELAAEFRHWFLTDDTVPKTCLFTTEPPVQTDLLADKRILVSERDLTRMWWKARIAVLGATIAFMAQHKNSQELDAFI